MKNLQTERRPIPQEARRPATARTLAVLALSLILLDTRVSQAGFSPEVLACRATIAQGSTKLSNAMVRAVAACHKSRSQSAAMAGVDCNDLASADPRGKVARAEQKFLARVGSTSGRCAGLSPAEALYSICPLPCQLEVPQLDTFDDVADCLACQARDRVESLARTTLGTPASPLPSTDHRCADSMAVGSARLFQTVMKDVTRCQTVEEKSGAMDVEFCTAAAFPRPVVEDGVFWTENRIVANCDLDSFANLDSCADSQFGMAICVGEGTLGAAQGFVRDALGAVVTTTTTTTTTTMEPILGDPQCPDRGELVLFARDSNIPCTTNADCDAPRHCDANVGICVTISELDSGWTGFSHDSDLDNGVVSRSRLLCQGPGPVCGECEIAGIDPVLRSCRCNNNIRQVCDRPFAPDTDNCGGAMCDCYFGAPIPLSSAGTPACIVNRYAEDISGTVNVDVGSSEIRAKLSTRVYLGITTTQPCPVCNGVCSNDSATACAHDDDCGGGNTCLFDTPGDGVRDGLCTGGEHRGQACDVGGINPSFPARSGGAAGGGGYSLDCMPSTGINISGAGLALDVTQTTGTQTLHANMPCSGGNCPCKTCSAAPSTPCNGDSDCEGGACAVSSRFTCGSNADCSNLDLGTCASIKRCSKAANVTCTTNADCQNYTQGGPCQPSTCSAQGGAGATPSPNQCDAGGCTDMGNGEGQCTTGPDDRTCDGLVRANGEGVLSCANNADCQANDPLNGNCTLLKRRDCFLDPIIASGTADPEFPVGAATFCVPPTVNGSINQVAGLPGPARVVNQGRSRAFCASDPLVEYVSGVGGCP